MEHSTLYWNKLESRTKGTTCASTVNICSSVRSNEIHVEKSTQQQLTCFPSSDRRKPTKNNNNNKKSDIFFLVFWLCVHCVYVRLGRMKWLRCIGSSHVLQFGERTDDFKCIVSTAQPAYELVHVPNVNWYSDELTKSVFGRHVNTHGNYNTTTWFAILFLDRLWHEKRIQHKQKQNRTRTESAHITFFFFFLISCQCPSMDSTEHSTPRSRSTKMEFRSLYRFLSFFYFIWFCCGSNEQQKTERIILCFWRKFCWMESSCGHWPGLKWNAATRNNNQIINWFSC